MMTQDIHELVAANRKIRVKKIDVFPLQIDRIDHNNNFFFCGATIDSRNHIIGIPNKYPHVLDIDPQINSIEQWGDIILPRGKGWTGGGLASDGKIFGFPRGADSFLCLNTTSRSIQYRKLTHQYNEEHHYGGVLTDCDIIYQPPKNSNNILMYDIKTDSEKEIQIGSLLSRNRLFYGGVMDLDGNVFFFPAGKYTRVCMISKKGSVKLVGKVFRRSFFNSGTLGYDGDIYGFSSYGKGIIHIDTKHQKTKIQHKDLEGGFFGAKLGFNGKIYSVPGDSDVILEYDPVENKISDVIELPDCEIGKKAKCAGGAIDREGNIWFVPAMGHYIYKAVFEGIKLIPNELLYKSVYFKSFY